MERVTRFSVDRLPVGVASLIPIDILDIIARNIGAGVVVISRDYRTLWASGLIERNFGKVEGKLCYEAYNKRSKICDHCGVREIFEAGAAEVKHEQTGLDRQGHRVWSEIIALPIKNDEGAVVSALEIVMPVTERRHAEHAFRAIHAISQTVNRSLDLETVLDAALENVMDLFTPHSAFIRLLDPTTKKLVFAAQKGLTAEELTLLNKSQDRGEGLTGLAVDSSEVLVVEDLLTDPRTANTMGFSRRIGCRSVVTIPLFAKEKLVGNMSFRTREPRPYSREEIDLCRSIGHQIGVAIENATLYREREANIGELQRAHQDLRSAAEELENRVRERTADLREVNRQLRREIEERRKAQEQCTRAQEEAEAASAAKSEFLANMSHELRTPLHHIMGFTELLLDGSCGDLSEAQHEYLTDVRGSGDHLLSLINDMLDLAKVEAGKEALLLAEVQLPELLEECLAMFKDKTVTRGIRLSLAGGNIPAEIHADRRKLKQVLCNLVSNAVKYTADGGRVSVSVRQRRGGKTGVPACTEIRVADSGIGLRREDLERIFNPFEQVEDTRSRRFPGVGLGLSLSKRLVELHGGKIWAESAGLDRGSTFAFTIPSDTPPR
ncbi:MAG: ATP-binding protein [Syntrophales bacterium]